MLQKVKNNQNEGINYAANLGLGKVGVLFGEVVQKRVIETTRSILQDMRKE